MHHTRLNAAIVLGLSLIALCSCRTKDQANSSDASMDAMTWAYRQGIAEAIHEIVSEDMTMYTFGWPQSGHDPETGLRLKVVGGDAVNPFTLQRIEAHNFVIRQYLAEQARIENQESKDRELYIPLPEP